MKNIIILLTVLFSLKSIAAEKGVYVCNQVGAEGSKKVSVFVRMEHTWKALPGEREKSVFSVTGLTINQTPTLVSVNFSDPIELENNSVQFSQTAGNGQPALDFSLTLNDSRSVLSLRYADIQLDHVWMNCKISY